MPTNPLLIELQYLPPIAYFAVMAKHGAVVIEQHENFVKSTNRNRTYIAGPNGKLRLTIPLKHGKNQRSKYRDVEIFYEEPWQKIHWQSLISCYRRSPFFEFYEDRFYPFYHQEFDFLFDFNLKLLQLLLELLQLDVSISMSSEYFHEPPQQDDFRNKARERFDLPGFRHPEYQQVFEEKTGFLPNLSVVDLLFAEGPRAGKMILESIRYGLSK